MQKNNEFLSKDYAERIKNVIHNALLHGIKNAQEVALADKKLLEIKKITCA